MFLIQPLIYLTSQNLYLSYILILTLLDWQNNFQIHGKHYNWGDKTRDIKKKNKRQMNACHWYLKLAGKQSNNQVIYININTWVNQLGCSQAGNQQKLTRQDSVWATLLRDERVRVPEGTQITKQEADLQMKDSGISK